jgi:imidazole glycerol phosphate synthase glutamine amidotransferase subunit
MTVIIDYGAGNLRSVQNTLDELGAAYTVSNQANVVSKATKLILPGVGHFGQMMTALAQLNLRTPILRRISAGIPTLGICLGLQCLYESSEEAPEFKGFGIFPGTVKRFQGDIRIPHMGWNSLDAIKPSRLLAGLGSQPYAYFANSYYASVFTETVATTEYVQPFTSVLEANNVFGIQCHPEKSGPVGLRIVKNFLELERISS